MAGTDAVVPLPPTKEELRLMFRAFGDAKDRWKIDGATMKGYYLHSASGYLYIWNQAAGVLYEHLQSTGMCQAVWSSAIPQLNAEIWTVLPLPPTDPAAFQATTSQPGELPNIDVFLVLTVAHEAGKELTSDVLEAAMDDFNSRFSLNSQARRRMAELPSPGQHWVIQSFRGASDGTQHSQALMRYVASLQMKDVPPWGNSACTLRVEATGAIIGRCCPDLDALCREDALERLAQAHSKIMCEKDRFFICDMETSEEGTLLDGFAVNSQWVGPLQTGSLLTIGPLRIKIELSDMAKDTPIEGNVQRVKRAHEDSDSDENGVVAVSGDDPNYWRKKIYKRSEEDKIALRMRQDAYKDRAEERRQRTGPEGGKAVDHLISKFEKIKEAERLTEEFEAGRVEAPTQEAHREVNMNVDGSFIGHGSFERAGIGFASSAGELIPEVLDPKSLSAADASRLKTQLRFKQASEGR